MKHSLVVDDSKVVRTVTRGIMESLGFSVEEAEDGKQALDQCAAQKPDVVMLDWNMPVMNGMEFLVELRKKPEFSDTTVIFCTTETDVTKIMEARAAGANEYVMKPYDEDIIRTKLEQLGMV